MAKLSFLLGAATGYVLGARAGRQRYDQIRSGAGKVWQSRSVQHQVSTAKHAAKTKAAPAALDAVSTAATAAGDTLRQGAGRITGTPGVMSRATSPATRRARRPSRSARARASGPEHHHDEGGGSPIFGDPPPSPGCRERQMKSAGSA